MDEVHGKYTAVISEFNSVGNVKEHKAKKLVEETVAVMENNVKILDQREERLTELANKADDLEKGAEAFELHTRRIVFQKKKWYNALPCRILCVIPVVLAIIFIVGFFYFNVS